MNALLRSIFEVDTNNNEAVKDVVNKFFQALGKHINNDCYRWLSSLDGVLKRYPKYCISHRPAVETLLTNFIDARNISCVIEAAKCAHTLQQIRPSFEKTATPKSCWRNEMNALCNAAHTLIDDIFNNTVDIYKSNLQLQTQSPTNSPLATALSQINIIEPNTKIINNKQHMLCNRLRNIFVFIQAMFVEEYPVAKPVQPQVILDVIVRTLSVSSSQRAAGALCVSDVGIIKTQALRTLDALVFCLGNNLIPYSPLLIKAVMQTLKWSKENDNEVSSDVRCVAYATLSACVRRVLSAGRGDRWCEQLAQYVCDDVTPHTRTVQLTMNNPPNRHMSKKAKRRLANSMLQQSALASHAPGGTRGDAVSDDMNDEVAIAALECVESLLIVCGVFLKPEIHKQLQRCLVRECHAVRGYSERRALRLLRALEAARAGCPAATAPTHHCLHLYAGLLTNHSTQISNFCSEALLNIRLNLHCSPPSLDFVLDVEEHKTQNSREQKKTFSDRNRIALEELLGSERMQQNIIDVIEDADEPLNKKARIEKENEENISISSDSENSVVICDNEDDKINAEIIKEFNQREFCLKGVGSTNNNDLTKLRIDVDLTKIESNNKANIYEAVTQLPINVSNDTIDAAESPPSLEVAYDYPTTEQEKISVITKIDEENIPSSIGTDDLDITCGQQLVASQDIEKRTEITKVNGVDSPNRILENGDADNVITVINDKVITINDMLADFVDELNVDIV